jgi:hypothetical protein
MVCLTQLGCCAEHTVARTSHEHSSAEEMTPTAGKAKQCVHDHGCVYLQIAA